MLAHICFHPSHSNCTCHNHYLKISEDQGKLLEWLQKNRMFKDGVAVAVLKVDDDLTSP